MAMKQIFQDNKGQLSAMRVYSFIALIEAMILSFQGAEYPVILAWIVAAFAPKAIQKFAER